MPDDLKKRIKSQDFLQDIDIEDEQPLHGQRSALLISIRASSQTTTDINERKEMERYY